MKCDYCTEKCPQEELACEIAKGRMYATKKAIGLERELEAYRQKLAEHDNRIRVKAIDEFAEALRFACLDSCYKEVGLHKILEIAEKMKGGVV